MTDSSADDRDPIVATDVRLISASAVRTLSSGRILVAARQTGGRMMSRAQLLAAVSVGLLGVVFANFSGAQEAPDEGLTLRLDASVLDADDEFGFGACVDGCIDKVEGLVFENLDGFSSPALGEPAGDADAVDLDADAPAVVFDRQTHLATTNFLDATFLTDTSSRDESTV